MANEWLAEGFRQLHLAAAWGAYGNTLLPPPGDQGAGAAYRQLRERLRRDVLEPFLLVEWIPGLQDVVSKVQPDQAPTPEGICTAFLRSWPGDLEQSPDADARGERLSRSLRQLLLAGWASADRSLSAADGRLSFPDATAPATPVLEPVRPEEMALAWISQAQALQAWPGLAAAVAEADRQTARQRRWAELREECGRVRQELEEAQHQPSRLQTLLGVVRFRKALNGAASVLARCQEQLAELADYCRPSPAEAEAAASARRTDLEQTIRTLLEQTPRAWPPRVLAETQEGWGRRDSSCCGTFLSRMSPGLRTPATWGEWNRSLHRQLPTLPGAARARLILLRALVEAGRDPFPPDGIWDRVESAARSLCTGQELDVEVVRDGERQPRDWFVVLTDPSLERPRLGQAGLALRNGGGTWICFPRGEQYQPAPAVQESLPAPLRPQTPQECILAELDALVKEAETLALAGQKPAAGTAETMREAAGTWHDLGREPRQALEEKWLHGKEKWLPSDFEPLPVQWTFLRPVLWTELDLEEKDLSPVFRGSIPRGVVFRVKAFGLRRRGGELIRPAAVCVSAGPSPAGFGDLYRLVEQPASPGEEALKQRLGAWPAACLQDALDVVAVRLFIDFWGPAGDEIRSHRREAAGHFGEQLSLLLQQELGLETFLPESYQDYPDGWLLLHTDHGAVTGKVRSVLRPGLKDQEGNLHVPAIVEVD